MTHVETWVNVGERSSSQEHIVGAGRETNHPNNHSDEFVIEGKEGGISKTVEFEFHTSRSPV